MMVECMEYLGNNEFETKEEFHPDELELVLWRDWMKRVHEIDFTKPVVIRSKSKTAVLKFKTDEEIRRKYEQIQI